MLPLDIATSDPRELTDWLGLPSGAAWIRLRTERPINRDGEGNAFLTEEPDGRNRLPFRMPPSKRWHRFNVILFGALVVTGEPPEESTWPYWGLGGAWIQLRCAGLWETGSPLRAEAAWSLRHGDFEYIRFDEGRPTPGQLARAGEAIQLLRGLAKRGMSDEDAFEEAVGFGLEWLADNPGAEPNGFTFEQLRRRRPTGPDALRKWMKDKHFGIRQVQRELERRIARRG